MRPLLASAILALFVASPGCMSAYRQSLGVDSTQTFSRVYRTDFDTAWQAVLEALKSAPLDVSNRDGGFIQTRWIDNTADRNFVDSFGDQDTYLKAQYRFRVNVGKGFFNGRPTIRVTVQKDQLVQHDVLEGWKPVETDAIDENTLLYRIGRIVWIKTKLAQLQQLNEQKEIQDTKF